MNTLVATSAAPLVSGVIALASALVATAVGYYFRRVSQVTVGEIEFLSARVSGLDRVRTGVVICDYVDVGTLATLATQYGIQRRPDEVERSSAAGSQLRAEVGIGGSKVGAGSDQTTTERALFRAQSDPNLLTQEVLDALERDAAVRTDLSALPTVGLDELRQIAEGGGVVDAEEIYETLIVASKAREFSALANSGDLAIIDSEWRIQATGHGLSLILAQLGEGQSVADMPAEVSLIVPMLTGPPEEIGQAMWTAPGRLRVQGGARIRASVLGRTGSYNQSARSLTVLPIVVFERLAAQRAPRSGDDGVSVPVGSATTSAGD